MSESKKKAPVKKPAAEKIKHVKNADGGVTRRAAPPEPELKYAFNLDEALRLFARIQSFGLEQGGAAAINACQSIVSVVEDEESGATRKLTPKEASRLVFQGFGS